MAFSRAPSHTLRPNSASAAASEIVSGFGLCATTTSKNGLVNAGLGLGPVGIMAKYLSYLNSLLTPVPNSAGNTFFLCMATGMAGAIMLVA